jgi:hypothetical protein
MSDVELVVKMPEKMYHKIIAGLYDYGDMNVIIQNSVPLPKGHGRLIDADAVLVEPFGNTYKDIDIAETIIEADRSEKE